MSAIGHIYHALRSHSYNPKTSVIWDLLKDEELEIEITFRTIDHDSFALFEEFFPRFKVSFEPTNNPTQWIVKGVRSDINVLYNTAHSIIMCETDNINELRQAFIEKSPAEEHRPPSL